MEAIEALKCTIMNMENAVKDSKARETSLERNMADMESAADKLKMVIVELRGEGSATRTEISQLQRSVADDEQVNFALFCIILHILLLKMVNYALRMMRFVLKMMNIVLQSPSRLNPSYGTKVKSLRNTHWYGRIL